MPTASRMFFHVSFRPESFRPVRERTTRPSLRLPVWSWMWRSKVMTCEGTGTLRWPVFVSGRFRHRCCQSTIGQVRPRISSRRRPVSDNSCSAHTPIRSRCPLRPGGICRPRSRVSSTCRRSSGVRKRSRVFSLNSRILWLGLLIVDSFQSSMMRVYRLPTTQTA
jgi:hypothetical protein